LYTVLFCRRRGPSWLPTERERRNKIIAEAMFHNVEKLGASFTKYTECEMTPVPSAFRLARLRPRPSLGSALDQLSLAKGLKGAGEDGAPAKQKEPRRKA
jgi:hypothetical protein